MGNGRASHRPGRLAVAVAAVAAFALPLAACTTGSPGGTGTTGASTGGSATPTGTTSATSTVPAPVPTQSPPSPTTTRPTSTTRPPTSTSPRPTTRAPSPTSPTTKPPSTTCSIPSSLLGRDLTTLGTSRKVLALTFDGGADNAGVASILSTLSAKGVPATFFLTGEFVNSFPASARAVSRYPVGNHTFSHPDLTLKSDSAIRTEIRTAASRIKAVTGQDPRPYFRFPFGAVNARTISVVNSECYVPFRWTVDTLGWKGTSGGQSVSTVVDRVLDAARPGEIVLMHVGAHPTDHSTLDASALPAVIDGLRARGYSFVTLGAVIGPAP
ncbi:polysaccharide deacetylase [Intrasporangium oryzae NRRL B-24470]|uniref:Polysaccharide deacetylase n=1 Tax=Intrasporangium oryzae NRRL B-24470 TaxID=1386089 RepID=W9G8U3_9MICO|nr:polysaccharide deacetylase family protein [Intrasporangium oryzae]EWT02470.1 polysaccharide deacetylase [Intrasporangium oryzae NRRL B-24470]